MSASSPARTSWQKWVAWGFCLLIFCAIVGDALHTPTKHTTMPTYRTASTHWWAGEDAYSADPNGGFLYFPQAAFLFSPFNVLPFSIGEVLWRAFIFGIFLYGLVRVNQFFLSRQSGNPDKNFLILVLLAVPSSLACLRNAQFDMPLAGLIVMAAAEIAGSRWNAATVWLCLAVALKPLAVVPLLLFGAIYWKLIPRVIIGLLVVLALPFFHWSPGYVAHEYYRCVETLMLASKGEQPKYSDLFAMLSFVNIVPSYELKTVIRVIFALVFLGLAYLGSRRLNRVEASWLVGALSADYLMLFNPRTEACSYVFLGPWVASLAIFYMLRTGRTALVWFLGFAAVGLACDGFPKIGQFSVHLLTDRWFKPLMALLFFGVLVEFILGRGKEESSKK